MLGKTWRDSQSILRFGEASPTNDDVALRFLVLSVCVWCGTEGGTKLHLSALCDITKDISSTMF